MALNYEALVKGQPFWHETINDNFEKMEKSITNGEVIRTEETILASGWVGTEAPYVYDLGISDDYDFKVDITNTYTKEKLEALQSAQITGNGSDNLLRAYGEKPTTDFPVVVRKWVK